MDNYKIPEEDRDAMVDRIMKSMVNTEEFNVLIDKIDPDWTDILTTAEYDPWRAIYELGDTIKAFFVLHDVDLDMIIEWLVVAVACSPEFKYVADISNPNWIKEPHEHYATEFDPNPKIEVAPVEDT